MARYSSSMNKFLVFLGGVIALVGVILPLSDKTMAWWWIEIDPPILDSTTHYLLPFGTISNNDNNSVTEIESSVITLISVLVIGGALLLIIGGVMDNKNLAAIGLLMVIGGLIYFLQALGQLDEVEDLFTNKLPNNVLFGSETRTYFFVDFEYTWQLGTGYFISWIGAILSIVGLVKKR